MPKAACLSKTYSKNFLGNFTGTSYNPTSDLCSETDAASGNDGEDVNSARCGDSQYGYDDGASVEIEIIEYARKTEDYHYIPAFPDYYCRNDNLENSCANVGGANIIGYYGRFYKELAPDFTPGINRESGYYYYPMGYQPEPKQAIIENLYVRMGTNMPEDGTSQAQYKNGLSEYVRLKGRCVDFMSLGKNNCPDISEMKKQIDEGVPVTLYLSGYNFTCIMDCERNTKLYKQIYSGNHIAVAFGINTVKYFNEKGEQTKELAYLDVATGNATSISTYVLDNNGVLVDAEATKIY